MSDHQLCSRHIRAIQHFVDSQERRIGRLKGELEEWRAHCKELEDALLDARHDALPSELTEDDLPERLRARLMPEGMEWPRFEDGEPVRVGDEVATTWGSVPTSCEAEAIAFTADGVDLHDSTMCLPEHVDFGERVKRPAPPATASQGRRDGGAPDSWERLGEDIMGFGIGYASALPDEADRERDALVARAKALAAGPDVVRPGEVV